MPFMVMEVLERASIMEQAGIKVIHLEVGEPDIGAPACVKTAVCRAIQEGRTDYTHSLGDLALREAICRHYRRTYAADVSPDQVIVTAGTSPALFLIFSALIERGDEVIISDPHYACYPNFVTFLEGIPVAVPVFEEDGFQYTPEAIEARISTFDRLNTNGIGNSSWALPFILRSSKEKRHRNTIIGICATAD